MASAVVLSFACACHLLVFSSVYMQVAKGPYVSRTMTNGICIQDNAAPQEPKVCVCLYVRVCVFECVLCVLCFYFCRQFFSFVSIAGCRRVACD